MNETLIFIVKAITDIYATVLLIRLLLQLVGANVYNPISQSILKVCAPVVNPLYRVLPAVGRFNTAALVAAILVKWGFYVLLATLGAVPFADIFAYLAVAAFDLFRVLIEIYFWGIFILVIFSWVGTTPHPAVVLVSQIIEPYLGLFRKHIPPIGMIDISPMAAIFTLMIIRAQLLPIIAGFIRPLLS